jgi:hypothetical protein
METVAHDADIRAIDGVAKLQNLIEGIAEIGLVAIPRLDAELDVLAGAVVCAFADPLDGPSPLDSLVGRR